MKNRFISALKETFYFTTSKIFIKNFSLSIFVLGCFFLLSFQGLKYYTNHGESVSVPNLKGQTLAQVQSKLRKANLSIQVIDSMFDADKLPLTIMEQTPLPTKETGLKVKASRTIYLTVNSVIPPMKSLPSIWDKNLNHATRVLENNGFQVIEKERRPDKAMNTILEVYCDGKKLDRNKKNQLPANSIIELVIADGGGSKVEIPNLICLPYSEAAFLVEGSNLNILIIEKDGTVTDEASAYVWKQNPMPESGLSLPVGTEISVWISKESPADCPN